MTPVLLAMGLGISLALSWWNGRAAGKVHQWSGDGKNIYVFISRLRNLTVLTRDFPFSEARAFKFYQPAYLRLALWVSRVTGDVAATTRVLNFLFALVYVTGWLELVHRLTGSTFVAVCALFVVVPHVNTISGDGIAVGVPTTWTSRSMSNGLLPWFFLLVLRSGEESGVLPSLFVVAAIMFNFHPTAALGTFPVLGYLATTSLANGRTSIPELTLSASLLALGCLPFVFNYLRTTALGRGVRTMDWRRINALAFERFELWPFVTNAPAILRRHNRAYQFGVGLAYTLGVLGLWSSTSLLDPGVRYEVLLILNLLILFFLHTRPGGTFGLLLCIAAALSVFRLDGEYGSWMLAVLMTVAAVAHRLWTTSALWGLFALAFGGGIAGLLSRGLGQGIGPVKAFDWLLAWSVPLIFTAYFWGSWLLMDLLPRRFGWPLTLIDWSRLVKVVQVPLYLSVIALIDRSLVSAQTTEGIGRLLAVIPLAAIVASVHGYIHGPGDNRFKHPMAELEVFDWARAKTPPDALFHVVLTDHWFAFDFRVNTLRSITGSWKDGGVAFYSDPELFLEWHCRLEFVKEAVTSRDLERMLGDAKRYGADFLIVSRDLVRSSTDLSSLRYQNSTYLVLEVV